MVSTRSRTTIALVTVIGLLLTGFAALDRGADVTDTLGHALGAPVFASSNTAAGRALRDVEFDVGGQRWRSSASPAQSAALQPSWLAPLLVFWAGVLVTVLAIAVLALEFARSKLRRAKLPRAVDGPQVAAAESADSGAAQAGLSLRLLTLDDDPAVGLATRRLLRANGHEVVTATSAEEALDQLRARPFDVVLSDLRLRCGMDGWALAAEVHRTWPRVRFVVATRAAGIDWRAARAAGIEAVLHKPYQPEELRVLLTNLGSLRVEQAA